MDIQTPFAVRLKVCVSYANYPAEWRRGTIQFIGDRLRRFDGVLETFSAGLCLWIQAFWISRRYNNRYVSFEKRRNLHRNKLVKKKGFEVCVNYRMILVIALVIISP